MTQKKRIFWLKVKITIACLIACALGAFITFIIGSGRTFSWIQQLPGVNIPLWIILVFGVAVIFVICLILLAIRLSGVWKWLMRENVVTAFETSPNRIRKDALNLPVYYAGFVWLIWGMVAGFLAVLGGATLRAFLEILVGIGLLAGFASTAFTYFLVEWIWRSTLPRFFQADDIIATPAFRMRLRTRLFVFFIILLVPLVLSIFLVRSQTALVMIGFMGVILVIVLGWLSGSAVARPLEAITPQLVAAQKGNYDQDVRVEATSNDEIGELSTRFNSMVENARLRDIEVSTIYHISQEITESLDLNTTLQAILEEVRKIIPYDGAEITLYDRNDNLLHVGAWSSSAQVIVDTRGRTYKLGEGYTGWVGQNRQSLLIPDVDAHHGHKPTIRQIAEGVFLNGYLGVPMVVKGNKMVGTLNLVSSRKSVFDQHSQQILEIIAPQAAIAIDNAEQVLERERELKAQIERLKIEIDDVKRAKQVADITETSYFRNLKEQAQKLRQAAREEDEKP